MRNEKIGVFLSACPTTIAAYTEATVRLGRWIGETGRTLVFGGSRSGLMEVLAKAVRAHGGRTFGVVPEIVVQQNRVSPNVDVLFHTANMADRKDTLIAESDVLVALPGGVGTIDEVFTALSMRSIGYEAPEVVLYNVDGCWDELLAMLHQMEMRGLLRDSVADIVHVATSHEALVELLEQI